MKDKRKPTHIVFWNNNNGENWNQYIYGVRDFNQVIHTLLNEGFSITCLRKTTKEEKGNECNWI